LKEKERIAPNPLILLDTLSYKGLSTQCPSFQQRGRGGKDTSVVFQKISDKYPLILGSKSPRRRALLEQIRLPYQVSPGNLEERGTAQDPTDATLLLAREKAKDAAKQRPNMWILGADTVVFVDSRILGKPENAGQARKMLEMLSGKDHQVVTGFCLINPKGEVAHQEAVTTQVRFKELTTEEIGSYINTGEPFGKAGSYAIQGIGAFMVESISGSYTNVVGLPLCALVKALIEAGALDSFPL